MRRFVRVVFIKNNKYLLIKEVKGKHYNAWNFVGGKVEQGETPIAAALREMKEEINLFSPLSLWQVKEVVFDNEQWQGFYFMSKEADFSSIKIMEPEKCDGYCFFTLSEINSLNTGIDKSIIENLKSTL